MPVYTASNGVIIADLTALRAIPSTDLPASGFVVLFVAAENSWFEYNPALTSGDATPVNSPVAGRWLRIGRDKLTANRTYFVRTDGSDSNTGLANTIGGAFLTIQKAIDVVASLDISIFNPTIQIGNGTYNLSLPIDLKKVVGAGKVILRGDPTTPSNVIIDGLTKTCFSAVNIKGSAIYELNGFKLQSSTSSGNVRQCIFASNSDIDFLNIDFGSMVGGNHSSRHIECNSGSVVRPMGNYSISSGANMHILVNTGGLVDYRDAEVTAPLIVSLVGSPSFGSGAFIWVSSMGIVNCFAGGGGLTFSGGATGVRYQGYYNSLILTNGGATTFFPGSSGGTVDASSVYG